jgi:hypothetical protein
MCRTMITTYALVLALSACKPKDEPKLAPEADHVKSTDRPTAAKLNLDDRKPADPPAAARPVLVFASQSEYEAKATPLFDAVIAAYKADGTDCSKLGADLSKGVTDHQDMWLAAVAFENAHPADKHVLAWSSSPYVSAAAPGINACKDNKAYADAASSITRIITGT